VKGNPQVITALNKLLKNELTAINQYFLHARMMKHWGFERLGKKIYEESIGEMKHADTLMQRILLLDGLPNLQDLGRLGIGEAVPECLKSDLKLESAARTDVVSAVALFEKEKDFVSRDRRAHPRGRRGAHRLPRDRDRPAGEGGRAELPAKPDRRRQGRLRVTRAARQSAARNSCGAACSQAMVSSMCLRISWAQPPHWGL